MTQRRTGTPQLFYKRDRQRTWWEGSVLGRPDGYSTNKQHRRGACLHDADRLMSDTDTKNNVIEYFWV